MSTNIDFKKPSDVERKHLKKYFHRLFLNAEVEQNVLDILASVLTGWKKMIVIALGPTNVGKSEFLHLIKKAIGSDYVKDLPKDVLSAKNVNPSAPRPELDRLRGSRIATVNELSDKAVFNCEMLKILSGGDDMYQRGLYSAGSEMKAMHTLYLSTNAIPKISAEEEAVWGRIKIINFKSTFSEKAPIGRTKEETEMIQEREMVFSRVEDMDAYTTSLAPVLLYTLFETLRDKPEIIYNKPQMCDTIERDTERYRSESNPIVRFINEVEIREVENAYIELKYIFSKYSDWYSSSYRGSTKLENRTQFERRFEMAVNNIFKKVPAVYRFKDKKTDDNMKMRIMEHIHCNRLD
jgi:phage/plasmid-associated DNA primase